MYFAKFSPHVPIILTRVLMQPPAQVMSLDGQWMLLGWGWGLLFNQNAELRGKPPQ